MATAFSNESNHCGDCGGQFSPTATYTIMEKQTLCDGCAKKKEDNIRKDPDAKQAVWKCPVHPKKDVEVIDLTCGYKGMCHTCALTDHAGHTFEDVEKFERTLRKEVKELQAGFEKKRKMEELECNIFIGEQNKTVDSIQQVLTQITAAVNEDVAIIQEEQRKRDDVIRQHTEEEIRRITRQMEINLRKSAEEAEENVSKITSRHCKLNEMCDTENARWNEGAAALQKYIKTLADEIESLDSLVDADIQRLIEKTKDIMLSNREELLQLRRARCRPVADIWTFKRCEDKGKVGELVKDKLL